MEELARQRRLAGASRDLAAPAPGPDPRTPAEKQEDLDAGVAEAIALAADGEVRLAELPARFALIRQAYHMASLVIAAIRADPRTGARLISVSGEVNPKKTDSGPLEDDSVGSDGASSSSAHASTNVAAVGVPAQTSAASSSLSQPLQAPQPQPVAAVDKAAASSSSASASAPPVLPSLSLAPSEDPLEGVREFKASDLKVLQVFESGSTKPQKVEMPDKSIKVLKYGRDADHIRTEVLTQKLYKAAGIPTLEAEMVKVDGKPAQLTDFVPDLKAVDIEDLRKAPDFYRHAAADMVMANWDLFKTGNWMKIGNRMVRADLGGALDRRAQGAVKEEFLQPEVREFDSMRQKAAQDNPYKLLTDVELADSVRTLAANLSPSGIDRALKEAGVDEKRAATIKEALIGRIKSALAWADEKYPLAEVHRVAFVPPKPAAPPEEEFAGVAGELEKLGYKLDPLLVHALNLAAVDPRVDLRRIKGAELIEPPKVERSDDPRQAPPKVGPEELLKESQYDEGRRHILVSGLQRLKTGVLMRRMSDDEKSAFIAASKAKTVDEVLGLLLPKDKRGEAVFSVNEPFLFERERKRISGEALTEKEKLEEKEDAPKYHWIMEIPITEGMLEFFEAYAYVSLPVSAKPTAFMGNPNLKTEGEAGGARNAYGIPNVVLKRQGLEKFWAEVKELRFVKADKHVWKSRSSNTELVKAKKLAEMEQKKQAAKAAKLEKQAAAKKLDEEGGLDLSSAEMFK